MRKSLLFTATAALLAAAGSAYAEVHPLGIISPVNGESFEAVVEKGEFVDFFKFTLASDVRSASFAILDSFGSNRWDVNFNSLALYSNTDGSLYSGDEALVTATYGDTGKGMFFDFGALSAGKYFLMASGEGLGTRGGKYDVFINVTAVPEPESFAMMLAGLGLMGTIARRRNKAHE